MTCHLPELRQQSSKEMGVSKSVRFHRIGGPEVLQIEDVTIAEPHAGEVRIKTRAIGLNRAEAMFRSRSYTFDPVFPAQLGYEAAGVVDAVGAEVDGLKIGDAVSVIPAFSFADYGMYGEYVIAPARAVVKHPPSLSWDTAAAIWMPFVTAWGALIDIAHLERGDTVVIPAASSSVGLAAIQVARHVGATPVALSRTSAKAAELKQAGAAHIVATEEQDVVTELLRLTDGKGARVVFDPVGGPMFGKLAQATAVGGIMFIYGALSPAATLLPLMPALARHLTIRGYELFEVTTRDDKLNQAKAFILGGLASGHFKPRIARTFPFDQIVEAHRFLEAGEQVGKIVVMV
jgi:NADPH:quinone reductase-like Zn-dependent oxidoreductase